MIRSRRANVNIMRRSAVGAGVTGFSGTWKNPVILSEAALAAERRIPPFDAPDGEILRRG